jgi:acyl-CoA thioester hydrolase
MTVGRSPESPFELAISVQPEDIDGLGHVNNVVYVRWVQDAATAHWMAQAPEPDRDTLGWVVLRHEIDYLRSAGPDDQITARTWVGTASRRRFQRHTELVRESDGRTLARALTVWCPVDRATGRTTNVSQEVRDRFSVADPEPPGA